MTRSARRTATVLAAALAATLTVTAARALAGPAAKEYSLKDANAVPASIAAGPDGALWAADGSLGRLWRITTMGRVSSIDVGSGPADAVTVPDAVDVAADPQDMTLAPDGDLYIALHSGMIGRLTLDGEFSRAARTKSDADTITVGPDGDVWYGAGDQGQVGRVRVP